MNALCLSLSLSVCQSVRLCVTFHVWAITYLCIDVLLYILVQMVFSLMSAVTLTGVHTSEVKVTQHI